MKKLVITILTIFGLGITSTAYAGTISGTCDIYYSYTDYTQGYPISVHGVRNVNITASAGIQSGRWMAVGGQLIQGSFNNLQPILVGFGPAWVPNAHAIVTDYDGVTKVIQCN